MKRSRILKKALKIAVRSGQGVDNLVGAYADELLKEALIKQTNKRKGFGYVERKIDFSDSGSGEDDGVRSEGEQPEQSGEP
tara:strand:- start:9607 stop:9849 length:243 start_codon:yes stop_codon:yes gene_type:complete